MMILGLSAAPSIAEMTPPAPVVGADSNAAMQGAAEGSSVTVIAPPSHVVLSTGRPVLGSITDTDTAADAVTAPPGYIADRVPEPQESTGQATPPMATALLLQLDESRPGVEMLTTVHPVLETVNGATVEVERTCGRAWRRVGV